MAIAEIRLNGLENTPMLNSSKQKHQFYPAFPVVNIEEYYIPTHSADSNRS